MYEWFEGNGELVLAGLDDPGAPVLGYGLSLGEACERVSPARVRAVPAGLVAHVPGLEPRPWLTPTRLLKVTV